MSVNVFRKSTGNLEQIAGNAMVAGSGSGTPISNIVFKDRANFPPAGSALTDVLYVATDENVIYRWNATINSYVQLDDTTNIKKIVGNI